MANEESLFAGLHIIMSAIPDGPAETGRSFRRYWYREILCQVCTVGKYKISVNPLNPWFKIGKISTIFQPKAQVPMSKNKIF